MHLKIRSQKNLTGIPAVARATSSSSFCRRGSRTFLGLLDDLPQSLLQAVGPQHQLLFGPVRLAFHTPVGALVAGAAASAHTPAAASATPLQDGHRTRWHHLERERERERGGEGEGGRGGGQREGGKDGMERTIYMEGGRPERERLTENKVQEQREFREVGKRD